MAMFAVGERVEGGSGEWFKLSLFILCKIDVFCRNDLKLCDPRGRGSLHSTSGSYTCIAEQVTSSSLPRQSPIGSHRSDLIGLSTDQLTDCTDPQVNGGSRPFALYTICFR